MTTIDCIEPYGFYEFFAGGGMANIGLGLRWRCLMANDISEKKARTYARNFPNAHEFFLSDVRDLTIKDLPQGATLAWASFPCQDLSLAGNGLGLQGERSGGSFWGFWSLMQGLEYEARPVPIIVLENVVGTITANEGNDFFHLLNCLVEAGYWVGPLIIDAIHFVPQSRPRLFIVAIKRELTIPARLVKSTPDKFWHPTTLQRAYHSMPEHIQNAWKWWSMPKPTPRSTNLLELIEENPTSTAWHTTSETSRLLELMSSRHLEKVKQIQKTGVKTVGAIYRRIRADKEGNKSQRAEIRLDNVSGCLRTGSGGSSRQFIMLIEGDSIRSRLLSTREAARLMGLPESYKTPEHYNEAYHLIGDGLVVPVVSWLEQHILTPLAAGIPQPTIVSTGEPGSYYRRNPIQLSLQIAEKQHPIYEYTA